MKNLLKSLVLVSALGLGVNASANLSNEQLSAGICIIANQGIHTVATERQAGTSKQATKAKLDKELAQLRRSFKDPKFIQGISSVWYRALDMIYTMPVLPKQADKTAFISGITEDAFQSCMDNLGRTQH